MKYVLIIIFVISGCAGKSVINSDVIQADFDAIKKSILRNRDNIRKLEHRRIGETGFYYIIDKSGIVVFHPVAVLVGINFKKYWFLNKILEKRSGCYSYKFGDIRHLVYFEQFTNNEILCFSISADEVDDNDPGCRDVAKGQTKTIKKK